MSRSPEEVVLGFLLDVRPGERPERVHDHLDRRVEAGRTIAYWIEFRHDVASPEGALR